MAAKFKETWCSVEVEVYEKSFRVCVPGYTTQFVYTYQAITREEARKYAKMFDALIINGSAPTCAMDIVEQLNSGQELHDKIIHEMRYTSHDGMMQHVDAQEVIHLTDVINNFETWDPACREIEKHKQVQYLYSILNYAYKAGRAAGKRDVAAKMAQQILEA